jgi:hypothetical protein
MIMKDVKHNKSNRLEYSSIINKCRTLLSNFKDYVVIFAWRQANESAHALAEAVLSHASHNIFDVIPTCIASIIINEMQ